jgi:hypothetical protein
MSSSVTAWSQQVSLAEHGHLSFALLVFAVGSPSLLFGNADGGYQWEL